MPPKKRDKPVEVPKPPNFDQLQTDHELFLQAFEKPTQIYRYLRRRHLANPLFLSRTLTYMRVGRAKSKNKRKNFKVDSLLEKVEAQHDQERPSGHMTLVFTGFFDKSNKKDTVSVEAVILKICHKKRKDVSSPIMQISAGQCEIARNPSNGHHHNHQLSQKAAAISVPGDSFSLSNGHLVKSYVLLLRITSPGSKNKVNGMVNGDTSDGEPQQKKRKYNKQQNNEVHQYGAELLVYDKQQRCLLSDGDYQLVLQEWESKASPRKTSSWETIHNGKNKSGLKNDPFEIYVKGPVLAFHLSWSKNAANGTVDLPLPKNFPLELSHKNSHKKNAIIKYESSNGEKPKKKLRVFYQFLYNNNTRQQTEARVDMHCPWCSVNCLQLYALLKHLKLCHNRFTFTYVPHPKGARIDVSINDCYDGSYAGNPQNLHTQTGFVFNRTGPVRRTPVTYVMVCRPKRFPPSLSEFLEPDDTDIDGPRPYISGHNRLYYHTGTCLPVRPQEIEIDSETENDPTWLRTKTQLMIDEFTDVNEGEKDLMKMWNLHVMKYGFVGDCQIPLAVSMFVDKHGPELISRSLYRNFLLHLSNLFDYGLVSASVVYTSARKLQKFQNSRDVRQRLRLPACS